MSGCSYYSSINNKSLHHINKAYSIVKKYLEPKSIEVPVNFHNTKAAIYTEIKEYATAEKSYIITLKQIENDPTIPSIAIMPVYYNLSNMYGEVEEYENKIKYLNKCIKIAQQIEVDYIEWVADPTLSMATTYLKQGKIQKGLELISSIIEETEKITPKTESHLNLLVNANRTLLAHYNRTNNHQVTINLIEKLTTLHKNHDYLAYESYANIASTYINRGELANARTALRKARKHAHAKAYGESSEQEYVHNNIAAQIELADQQPLRALAYCQLNMKFLDPAFDNTDLFGNPAYSKITDREKITHIIPNKIKVLEVLYAQRHPKITPELLLKTAELAIAGVEYKNNQFRTKSAQRYWLHNKAVPLFEKAIGVALSIHEQTDNPYYLNVAFQLSEQSKSMILRSILQDETAETFGGIPDSLIQKEDQLRRQINRAEKQLHDAHLANNTDRSQHWDSVYFHYSKQNDILLAELENRYPKYHQLKHQTRRTDIKNVQQALDNKTALIEYFQGKHQIYVFTITKNNAFAHHFPRTPTYDQHITDFQQQLTDAKAANGNLSRARERFTYRAFELYQTLLASSLPQDPNIQRLMFILDGKLGYLPFETLLTESITDQGGINFSRLPYLLHRYSINYNYSALLFLEQRKQHSPAAHQILALAPTYNCSTPPWRNPQEIARRKKFQELDGAREELQFLEEEFGGLFVYENNAEAQQATEVAFREHAMQYGILHLAVHGIVDHEKPELSGLALEEDSSRDHDNFLYAYEIKQLDLQQTQLVVLAACKTGDGQFQRGEGILSIGRSFMYAGVPSLLTTLWSLNDDTSPEIIRSFYEYLANGMDKDQALRQSKLDYLDNCSLEISAHPQLWACFVQVGDYAAIKIESQSIFNQLHWGYGIGSIVIVSLCLLLLVKQKPSKEY